jgi:bisphosphoglycerate-dependent phosphoglycerate mutase
MTDRKLLQQALDALDSECNATISHAQETIRKILDQPKKEWVGLTDDDVNRFVEAIYKGFDIKTVNEIEIQYFERLIKFIDRKLKEKNSD